MQTTMSFPYALSLYKDSSRLLTMNKKIYLNDDKSTNKSSIILFRCSDQAKDFRDKVMIGTNLQKNTWNLSCDNNDNNNYDDDDDLSYEKFKFAVYQTKVYKMSPNIQNLDDHIMIPTPFDEFDNKRFIDKLITYNISVFFMDSYNQNKKNLSVHGHIWTPPQNVVHYSSDIEQLYNINY